MIRSFESSDAAACMMLVRRQVGRDDSRASEQYFLDLASNTQCFVYDALGVVGFVCLQEGFVRDVFVDPEFVNQSVVSQLITHILSVVRSRGLKSLRVDKEGVSLQQLPEGFVLSEDASCFVYEF